MPGLYERIFDVMDYQKIVDGLGTLTCVMSVEKFPDGSYGNIRIVAANKAYIESIEANPDPNAPEAYKKQFIPNSPYEDYFPKDMNFEDFCFRAAILKQPMHTYVHPERFDIWFNIFMMPLESDEENIGYCTYTYEVNTKADTNEMTNLSIETSSDVLKTCIKLRGSEDFKKTMNEIIEDIRIQCGAKRCCIILTDFETNTYSVLCEAARDKDSIPPLKELINDDFFEIMKTWPDTIAGSDSLLIRNKSDMRELSVRNPIWYKSLTAANVDSLVLFPLIYNKETLGYIWATHFNTDDTTRIKKTLELTSFFLASEIYSRRLLERLELISKTDLLTGILNRNAMNTRVDRLVTGADKYPERMGVVFADLNGLKQINDSGGHSAGDRLLRKAAVALSDEFPDGELYRAGGDEFMIICCGISEEDFIKRIKELRSNHTESGVNFSVGFHYDEVPADIRAAMRIADEDMYKQKELYYKEHGGKKR